MFGPMVKFNLPPGDDRASASPPVPLALPGTGLAPGLSVERGWPCRDGDWSSVVGRLAGLLSELASDVGGDGWMATAFDGEDGGVVETETGNVAAAATSTRRGDVAAWSREPMLGRWSRAAELARRTGDRWSTRDELARRARGGGGAFIKANTGAGSDWPRVTSGWAVPSWATRSSRVRRSVATCVVRVAMTSSTARAPSSECDAGTCGPCDVRQRHKRETARGSLSRGVTGGVKLDIHSKRTGGGGVSGVL